MSDTEEVNESHIDNNSSGAQITPKYHLSKLLGTRDSEDLNVHSDGFAPLSPPTQRLWKSHLNLISDDLNISMNLDTFEKAPNILLALSWAITRVFEGEEDISHVLRGYNLEKIQYCIAPVL